MVAAVRRGVSQREVARRFAVSLCTVQWWLARANGQRLDRVDWQGLPRRPKKTRRTSRAIERRVLAARRYLRDRSVLGEYGAMAISRHLQAQGINPCPSVRTIGRILQRRGVLDGRRRIRRPAPLAGWYLPEVAAERAEVDCFDTIEDLLILSRPQLTVLTGVALHGGLPVAWPVTAVTSAMIVESLIGHWRQVGLPGFAQFDNDTRFQGPHQYRDSIGRVIRLCLSLHVTPVFVPPRETGFQAAVESFNGRWQAKVWSRFHKRSLQFLQERSAAYVQAVRERLGPRIESAPQRRRFPNRWRLNFQAPPRGTIVYIRRTTDDGRATFLGRTFMVDRDWCHRLVRAELHLDVHRIRFYALRRREPTEQPLLKELAYRLPIRPFKE
jgi:transposase